MNLNKEKKFLNDFIQPLYRDRLLFELNSSKKRINAIMRFSHDIENLIIIEKIYLKLKKFDDQEIEKFLKEQEMYVVSFQHLNGIIMRGKEVLEIMNSEHLPVIAIGTDITIIKKEFEKGVNNFYLLRK